MNRFEKIKDWLSDCPQLNDYLFFNVLPDELGSMAMTSDIGADGVIEEYIDGSKLVNLNFNVEITANYDKGTSDVNLEAMNVFEEITDWVKEQNALKNFPDFGSDVIHLIQATYVNPDIYIFDNDDSKCQYQAKYTIRYLEKG